jgi:chitodextrinase
LRKSLYTYNGFLQAIGKYPFFCNDKGDQLADYTMDEACKRELAVMFAHFNQETGYNAWHPQYEDMRQGLAHITEWNCTHPQNGIANGSCNYFQTWASWSTTAYPPQAGRHYYGRGPFQLSWNYNYGAFSKVLVESEYDSHMHLLLNPDEVH